MKRILLISLITLLSLNIYSQISRTKYIVKQRDNGLVSYEYYDENDNFDYCIFSMYGRNIQYQYITDIISLNIGNAVYAYDFFKELLEFSKKYKDEDGVSKKINDVYVSHSKKYGARYCLILPPEETNSLIIKDSDIEKYIKKLVSYCKEVGIKYE